MTSSNKLEESTFKFSTIEHRFVGSAMLEERPQKLISNFLPIHIQMESLRLVCRSFDRAVLKSLEFRRAEIKKKRDYLKSELKQFQTMGAYESNVDKVIYVQSKRRVLFEKIMDFPTPVEKSEADLMEGYTVVREMEGLLK